MSVSGDMYVRLGVHHDEFLLGFERLRRLFILTWKLAPELRIPEDLFLESLLISFFIEHMWSCPRGQVQGLAIGIGCQ